MLRHRAKNYCAGDLERLYPKLEIEEDFFVVYGFMTKSLQALMHPRLAVDVPAEGPRPGLLHARNERDSSWNL